METVFDLKSRFARLKNGGQAFLNKTPIVRMHRSKKPFKSRFYSRTEAEDLTHLRRANQLSGNKVVREAADAGHPLGFPKQSLALLECCLCFRALLLARLLGVPARYRVGYIYTGGSYQNVQASSGVYGFVRDHEGEKVLVLLNFGDQDVPLSLPELEMATPLLSSHGEAGRQTLRGNEAQLWRRPRREIHGRLERVDDRGARQRGRPAE